MPEPQAWARQLPQALVEVMSDARPAPQVIRGSIPRRLFGVRPTQMPPPAGTTMASRRAVVRRSGAANRSKWASRAPWSWTRRDPGAGHTAGRYRWPLDDQRATSWLTASASLVPVLRPVLLAATAR